MTGRASITLDIPWIGPSMNTIWAGKHWGFRRKVAADGHKAVQVAARGVKTITGRVVLEFCPMHKGRLYDPSNYAVTCKAIEDGLVLCKVIAGDTCRTVASITIHAPIRDERNIMRVKIIQVE